MVEEDKLNQEVLGQPHREICALCHEVSRVGFSVPDEVWKAAVHPFYQESIICLRCFSRWADERGVKWDKDIKFYPVSWLSHCDSVKAVEKFLLEQVRELLERKDVPVCVSDSDKDSKQETDLVCFRMENKVLEAVLAKNKDHIRHLEVENDANLKMALRYKQETDELRVKLGIDNSWHNVKDTDRIKELENKLVVLKEAVKVCRDINDSGEKI